MHKLQYMLVAKQIRRALAVTKTNSTKSSEIWKWSHFEDRMKMALALGSLSGKQQL